MKFLVSGVWTMLLVAAIDAPLDAAPTPAPPVTATGSVPTSTEKTITDDDPATLAALEAIAAAHTNVRDLTATFTQTRESAVLRRAVTTSGTIALRDTSSYWKTTKPYRSDMWVRGGEVSFAYPEDKLVEIYDLSDVAPNLIFGPNLDLKRLRASFYVTPSDWKPAPGENEKSKKQSLVVRLTPRTKTIATVMLPMDVIIDQANGHVHAVITTDDEGNRTRLDFKDIKTNVGITERDVAPNWPTGFTVQRVRVDAEAAREGSGDDGR